VSDDGISIVLPAFNEENCITQAIEQVVAYVDSRRLAAEIIVVDDGSSDNTATLARAMAADDQRIRVLSHSPNRGKGYSVRRGVLAARMPMVMFLDVDMATPISEADKLREALEAGADMAIGSRYLPQSCLARPQRWLRRTLGSGFRWLAIHWLSLGVSDVTCGFKGFRAEVARRLFTMQRENGWAFDAELIYLGRKLGYRIVEIPVRWYDSGDSRFHILQDGLAAAAELLRIRVNDWRGLYGP